MPRPTPQPVVLDPGPHLGPLVERVANPLTVRHARELLRDGHLTAQEYHDLTQACPVDQRWTKARRARP